MKAAKGLRRHDAEYHDFCGADLRGQNFKGQDLSGANFSRADIRSANFTEAVLKGCNFSNTVAGLQNTQACITAIASFVLAIIAGVFTGYAGYCVSLIVSSNSSMSAIGWASLVHLIIFLLLTLGISNAIADLANEPPYALLILILSVLLSTYLSSIATGKLISLFEFIYVLASISSFVLSAAIALTCVIVGAVAGEIVFQVLVALTFLTATVVALALSFIDIDATNIAATLITSIVTIVVSFVSIHVSCRSFKADPRYTKIRALALRLTAVLGTSFYKADLTETCFQHAQLKNVNLQASVIDRASWRAAKQLDWSSVGGTILADPKVRDLAVSHRGAGKSYMSCNLQGINLTEADLSNADLTDTDLSGATLQGANLERVCFKGVDLRSVTFQGATLRGCDLSEKNLSDQNLSDCDLSEANLARSQLFAADLTNTILTGACIKDWQINSETNLSDMQCDFIFRNLQWWNGRIKFTRRLPADSNHNFAPGEFTQIYKKIDNEVKRIFRNSIDWEAFAYAFNEANIQLQSTTGGELNLRKFEVLGDGLVSLTVETPPNADIAQIEAALSEERVARIRAEGALEITKEQLLNMMTPTQVFFGPVGSIGNQGTQGNVSGEVGGNQQLSGEVQEQQATRE